MPIIIESNEQGNAMLYGKFTIKKKIFFSLVVLGLFLPTVELFSYAVLSFVCLPMPGSMLDGNFSYITSDPDLGWVPVPGASAHIVKYPEGFDFTIRTRNFFRDDSQGISRARDCEIITIGDSHTFGYGLKDEQTLAFQLHSLLSDDRHECLVFNGGVPGYGPSQYYLRLRSLGKLAAGSLVVVYINPINDLTDLSKDIAYGSPKPYACIAEDGIEYVRPVLYNPKIYSHFARDFDSLNQAFNVTLSTAPPPAARMSLKSQTLQFLDSLRQKKIRFRWARIEPTEYIGCYKDCWEREQRLERVARDLFLHTSYNAAGQWTEISEFDSERRVAEELLFRILCDMKKHVESQQAHLLVVVAEECYGNQGFRIRLSDILKELLGQYTFEEGWSREAVKRAAQKANIPFLTVEYPAERIESMFIPYDGHTSADGFAFTAQRIVDWIEAQQFAFAAGKRSLEALVQADPDINRLDGNGYTRLHYAVQNGNYQTVERLISEGTDINVKDKWGETPLYIAASRGHKSIFEMLLDRGAEDNAKNKNGSTPLHIAVSNGQADIVALLIANGADVNARDKADHTPLGLATNREHTGIVELLHKHWAIK